MRRIAAPMAVCEDTITSTAIREARRIHLEKLTKVKDAVIKVVPRTRCDHQTFGRTLGGYHAPRRSKEGQVGDAWVRANSERKQGFLLSNASDDAPQNDVGRGSSERACGGHRRLQRGHQQVTFEARLNRKPRLDRASSRSRAGTRLHLGSRASIPRSQGSTESVGHVQCERSHEFHGDAVPCSTVLKHVENTSRRKQGDTSMTFW